MSQSFCPSCGFANDDISKFCSQCGTPMPPRQNKCPHCSAVIASNAVFCTSCGQKVAEPPANKQVPQPETRQNINEILSQMSPGDKVMRYGKEFTMGEDGKLYCIDERGNVGVDAASYFAVMKKEQEARKAAQAAQQPNNVESTPVSRPTPPPPPPAETQPLWDPASETQPLWDPATEVQSAPPVTASPPSPHHTTEYVHAQQTAPAPTPVQAPNMPSQEQAPVAPVVKETDGMAPEDVEMLDPLTYLAGRNAPAAQSGAAQRTARMRNDDYDDDDEDEDDEDDEVTNLKNKAKRFQSIANSDGYYDDRRPFDEEFYFESKKSIQWVPLFLGVAAIILCAVAFLYLRSMF